MDFKMFVVDLSSYPLEQRKKLIELLEKRAWTSSIIPPLGSGKYSVSWEGKESISSFLGIPDHLVKELYNT